MTQQGDVYTVTSRNKDELIASFRVTFDRANNISRFDVKEAQGQWSEFTLSSFNRKPVLKGNEFVFRSQGGRAGRSALMSTRSLDFSSDRFSMAVSVILNGQYR